MDMHVDTRWRRGGGFDGKLTATRCSMPTQDTYESEPSVAHNYQVVAKNKKKK